MDTGNIVLRTIPLSEPIIGTGVGILALFVAASIMWILSATLFRSSVYHKSADGIFTVFNGFIMALSFAVAAIYKSLTDSFLSLFDKIQKNLSLLIGALLLGVISLLILWQMPAIVLTTNKTYQCTIRPYIDGTINPVLLQVMALYNSGIGAWNAAARVSTFIMTGWTSLLKQCAMTNIGDIISQFGKALGEFLTAIGTFLNSNVLTSQLNLLSALYELSLVADYGYLTGDCFCTIFEPFWAYIAEIPQYPSAHVAINCFVNAWISAYQQVLFQLPPESIDEPVIDIQCAQVNAGYFAEDVVYNFVEFVFGLINHINITIILSGEMQPYASTMYSPPTLGVIWRRVSHAASNDPVDSRELANAFNRVSVQALPDSYRINEFWNITPGTNLTTLLGLDRILLVLQTPWSHIFTQPLAGFASVVNMTAAIVLNPGKAFSSASGLSYFQVGFLRDRAFLFVNAFADLLVYFDDSIPCPVSSIGRTIISIPFIGVEFFTSWLTALAYVSWEPGVPPPHDCSVPGSCGPPPPIGWSPFSYVPAYWAWPGNMANETLQLFYTTANCTAVVLGCNETMIENSNCTEQAGSCAVRASILVATSVVKQVANFGFYFTNLIQFNSTLQTFEDISFNETLSYMELFIDCVTRWIDMLDEDECGTDTPPIPIPDPHTNTTLPPATLPTLLPARLTYDCLPTTGEALNSISRVPVTMINDEGLTVHEYCDPSDPLGCGAFYGNDYEPHPQTSIAQVVGVWPNLFITYHVASYIETVFVEVTNGTVTNHTTIGQSGVDVYTETNCTGTDPIVDPLPNSYSCRLYTSTAYHFPNTGPSFGPERIYFSDSMTQVPCTFAPVFNYTCDANVPILIDENGQPHPLTYSMNGILVQASCTGSDLPPDSWCQSGNLIIMVGNYFVPLKALGMNQLLPCEIDYPVDYECVDDVAYAGSPQELIVRTVNDSTGDLANVTCIKNPIDTPPPCTAIHIEFITPRCYIDITLVGAEVHLESCGRRIPVVCSLPLIVSYVGDMMLTSTWYSKLDTRKEQAVKEATMTQYHISQQQLVDEVKITQMFSSASNDSDYHATYLYRKISPVCSFADTVRSGLQVFVEGFRAFYSMLQSFLVKGAVPDQKIRIATFRKAVEKFKNALCSAGTTFATFLPSEFACQSVESQIECGTGAICARNFICRLFDIPMLLVDIAVEFLETINLIVNGDKPTNSVVFGDDCSPENLAECVTSIIVYVIEKVIYTITMTGRGFAGLLDCTMCAITKGLNPNAMCVPTIYQFVDTLADLIDAIGSTLITAVVKVVMGLVSAVIYFFGQQWELLMNELFNNVLTVIGQAIGDIGLLIFQALQRLPVVGVIFQIIAMIVESACGFLQNAINLFANPPLDFGCNKFSVKRSCGSCMPGWLFDVFKGSKRDIAFPWDILGATHPCQHWMLIVNSGDYRATLNDVDRYDNALFCLAPDHWIEVPENEEDPQLGRDECSIFMAQQYQNNIVPSEMSFADREMTKSCLNRRYATEFIMKKSPHLADWMPKDILYNPMRWSQVISSTFASFSVMGQYREDKLTPIDVLVSTEYRERWSNGYDTSHIDNIDSHFSGVYIREMMKNASVVASATGVTSQRASRRRLFMTMEQELIENREQYGMTLAQYVDRYVAMHPNVNKKMVLAMTRRVAEFVGESDSQNYTFATNATDENTFSDVIRTLVDGFIRLYARPVPPPQLDVYAATGNDSYAERQRQYLLHAGTDGLLRDLAGVIATSLNHTYVNGAIGKGVGMGFSAARFMWLSSLAGVGLVRDMIIGTMIDTVSWWNPSLSSIAANSTAQAMINNKLWDPVANGETERVPTYTLWGKTHVIGQGFVSRSLANLGRAFKTMYNHIGFPYVQTSLTLKALIYTSPIAVDRAIRMQSLKQAFSTTTRKRQLLPDDPECWSQYPELCDMCLYADRFVGTIENATNDMIEYYNGTDRASFSQSNAYYTAQVTYFNDTSAPVVVGDSEYLPVRFPAKGFNLWRYLGDQWPKLGFTRLEGLLNDTYQSIVSWISDGAGDPGSLFSKKRAATANRKFWWQQHPRLKTKLRSSTVDQLLGDFLSKAAPSQWKDLYVNKSNDVPKHFHGDKSIQAQEVLPPTTLLLEWIDLILTYVSTCDHSALDGSQQTISIGQFIAISMIAAFVAALIISASGALGSTSTTFGNAGAVFGMLVLFGTIAVVYTWSYRCYPAFPTPMAQQTFHLLNYNLFPKSLYYLLGPINEASLNNKTVYACSIWEDDTYSMPTSYDVGFHDLGYYVSFFVWVYNREVFEWLESTRIPVLSTIIQQPFFQDRMNAWKWYNQEFADDVEFSQLNWFAFGTVIFSFFVAMLYFMVLLILFVFVNPIATAFFCLIYIATSAASVYVEMLTYNLDRAIGNAKAVSKLETDEDVKAPRTHWQSVL